MDDSIRERFQLSITLIGVAFFWADAIRSAYWHTAQHISSAHMHVCTCWESQFIQYALWMHDPPQPVRWQQHEIVFYKFHGNTIHNLNMLFCVPTNSRWEYPEWMRFCDFIWQCCSFRCGWHRACMNSTVPMAFASNNIWRGTHKMLSFASSKCSQIKCIAVRITLLLAGPVTDLWTALVSEMSTLICHFHCDWIAMNYFLLYTSSITMPLSQHSCDAGPTDGKTNLWATVDESKTPLIEWLLCCYGKNETENHQHWYYNIEIRQIDEANW